MLDGPSFFFFNDTATTEIYTLSLHDALPICDIDLAHLRGSWAGAMGQVQFMPSSYLQFAEDFDGDGRRDIWSTPGDVFADRKSTRLNSSHDQISYAVFCLKKKKKNVV